RAEDLEGLLQALDGHDHAGAEPPGVGKDQLHRDRRPGSGDPPRSCRRPGPPRASARELTAVPAGCVTPAMLARRSGRHQGKTTPAARPTGAGRVASTGPTAARRSVALLRGLDAVLVRLDVHLVALLRDDAGHLHARKRAGALVVLLPLTAVVEEVGHFLV